MRALVCNKLGSSLEDGLNNVKEVIIPIPIPSEDEVLVKVCAAALNFLDILIVQGKYQIKYKPPFVIGSEFAGIVTKIGKNVSGFNIGDRVAGFIRIGCFAQYTVCHQMKLFKIPNNMNYNDAASFCCVYGTAYMALVQRCKLNKSHTLLITAGVGGIGSAALQIGSAIKCKKIIACVGSDKKANIAQQNGATLTINYKKNKNWGSQLKKQGGIDIAIDTVGGDANNQCLKAINWYGKIAIVGFASGLIPKIKANRILLKNIDLSGIAWGGNVVHGDFDLFRKSVIEPMQLYAKGLIKPLIGNVYNFDLEAVKVAYFDLANRKSVGKLIINNIQVSSNL